MEKLTPEQQVRLDKYIKDKKLTKYRIAHDLKMSASTIANYLNGVTKPDVTKWELVCNYLGITNEWLMTGQNLVTTPHDKVPGKSPASGNVELAIEEVRLLLQARDDQYLNLHKDLEKLFRSQQEMLATLSALITKLEK